MSYRADNWDHWRSFLAVIDEGSLSGAAGVLRLTQPTLGRHVSALEDSIGAKLFTRSRSGLEPTHLALLLVSRARTMAMVADDLKRTASGERDEVRGTIRLAAADIVGTLVLPPILAAFRQSHPEIEIELALSIRNENLLRGEADIAVRMERPEQEAIVARHVGNARVGLYAHRRYVDIHGLPETIEALISRPIIGIDRDENLLAGISLGDRMLTRQSFAFRCDDAVAQLMAVKAGYGIGACHLGIAAGEPELIRVLPDAVEFEYEVWVAMHSDLRDIRRMRLMFDHLVESLALYTARQ